MYDRFPYIPVGPRSECSTGWAAIASRIQSHLAAPESTVCVECYPGVLEDEVQRELRTLLKPSLFIETAQLFRDAKEIDAMLAECLGDDPVFGRMNTVEIADFFDPAKLTRAKSEVRNHSQGLVLILGTGAALVCEDPTVLVYADMARWEIQLRQRRKQIGNLGANDLEQSASLKYKRAFFVDWRAADRLKQRLFPKIDFLLDTNVPNTPRMIWAGLTVVRWNEASLARFASSPTSIPAPGAAIGWSKSAVSRPRRVPNHAWCFDCVPEENSLLLGFGDARVEIPAINLVFQHPHELLGEAVHARFGKEFPIRFDFLDTMGGGNLSLQVHPLTEYIQDKFGMNYTQDESYYMLDAGGDGCVYLGLREDIDRDKMLQELRSAQSGGPAFPAEKHVNIWPAKKHDHFLIPAGTIHCSGKNSMVLEISATPYIFTFKLWDWGRLGLNGRPRPIHLDHGAANIQWDRTTGWVLDNLVNRITPLSSGEGWREERTGLHELEFIETRRHWFTSRFAPYGRRRKRFEPGGGREAVVESPNRASSLSRSTMPRLSSFRRPPAITPSALTGRRWARNAARSKHLCEQRQPLRMSAC